MINDDDLKIEIKDVIDLYQVDSNMRSTIKGCTSSFFVGQSPQSNQGKKAGFSIIHNISDTNKYRVDNILNLLSSEEYKYSYYFFILDKMTDDRIKSKTLLSFEEIESKFKNIKFTSGNGIMFGFRPDNTFDASHKLNNTFDNCSFYHGQDEVHFINTSKLEKFAKYIIHVKYKNSWYKIFKNKGDQNHSVNFCKTSYTGSYMPPEYFHFLKKVDFFNYFDIEKLLDQQLFDSIMSKVETSIIFG